MKVKNLLTVLFTMVLAFNMCVVAFAADTTVSDGKGAKFNTDIKISQVPTITVTIKKPGDVVVNPWGLAYTDPSSVNHNETIVSTATLIENRSNVNLDVSATLTAAKNGGNADFVSAPVTDETSLTAPTAFLFVELLPIAGTALSASDANRWANTVTNNQAPTSSHYVNIANETAPAKIVLEKADASSASTGTAITALTPKCGAVRISGRCYGGSKLWTASDRITLNVIFKFEPTAADKTATS